LRKTLWIAALVTVSLGCGGDSDNGGASGTGGAAGTGGAGGSGGSAALAAMPPCLAAVAKDCLPSGTCTTQTVDPNNPGIVNSCYGNGVKGCVTVNSAANTMATTATKADGKTVCYQVEMTFASGGGLGSMSLKDAAGTELATISGSADGGSQLAVVCKSDGKSYQWDWAAGNAAMACTAGTCPCP
jgi:hypothetical protein